MAVVIHADNDIQIGHRWTPGEPCRICGETTRAPVLAWACEQGQENLIICGSCAVKVKDGFTADLVHLVAIMELRAIYPEYTLARPKTFFKKDHGD